MKSILASLVAAPLIVVAASAARFQAAPHPDLGTDPVTPAMCAECHADAQESMQKGGHAPLVAQCPLCHDITGATETPYLRLTGAQLCDKCHRLPIQHGAPPPESIEMSAGVNAGRAVLPVNRQVRVDDRLRGHPVSNHPIANVPDPLHSGRELSCRTCHVAHGAAPRMFAFEIKPGENICKKCHDM